MLNLKIYEPLSNFALKFNLRRYMVVTSHHVILCLEKKLQLYSFHGRAVQVDSIKIRVESAPGSAVETKMW
jgi:hypothetical protein